MLIIAAYNDILISAHTLLQVFTRQYVQVRTWLEHIIARLALGGTHDVSQAVTKIFQTRKAEYITAFLHALCINNKLSDAKKRSR